LIHAKRLRLCSNAANWGKAQTNIAIWAVAIGFLRMLQSVRTALDVFELVAKQQPIGVSELARLLDVNKSTVQRCLETLHDAGWLRPEGDGATKWVITGRILDLGGHVSDGQHLARAAIPVMLRLRETTQETIHLAVPDQRDALLIERLESPQPVRIFYPVGTRVPLNAAATGKAILSTWDPLRLEVFMQGGLDGLTVQTIVETGKLQAELDLIRTRGWSEAIDELGEGASAVAASIKDPSGFAVAAISVSAPTSRFGLQMRKKHAAAVMHAAHEIADGLFGGQTIRSRR
jgi:IclR family acetate operon transcriptional repressor